MTLTDPRVLLDSSSPFDDAKVTLLDQVVAAMFGTTDSYSREVAHKVLGEFKCMPEAWSYVAVILNKSQDPNTKFVALQILENTIQTRWNVLPEAERAGIKAFVTDLAIRLASDERASQTEKHFVNKVNENLIQIVKQEWPERWPGFLTEVCASCRASQSLCENNMRLLNMLSEEVFDFGEKEMVSRRATQLMQQLTHQFQEVFDVCMFVLRSAAASPLSVKESLVQQTLRCLSHYLKWIPLGYIFQTDLLQTLLNSFWEPVQYRADCLRCLTEIASLQLSPQEQQLFKQPLTNFWMQLVSDVLKLPPQTLQFNDPSKVPPQMRLFWESFYAQLALCLTAFLKNHRETIAEPLDKEYSGQACVQMLQQVAKMTELQHEETFQICLEFWYSFAEALLAGTQQTARTCREEAAGSGTAPPGLLMGERGAASAAAAADGSGKEAGEAGDEAGGGAALQQMSLLRPSELSWRVKLYADVLSSVRKVMISKMAKPQEIYIQFDEETGEVTRDYEVDTAEVALYNMMRCTQVLLTNLGQEEMEATMLETLNTEYMLAPVQLSGWNPTALNRLCYSIGSISGAMHEHVERRFLVQVIRSLLNLCETMKGKGDKAIIASNIMYVVGQYPRFLKAHWKFLKTVVHKLFEFMFESFPGIKDMACETFLKVAHKCKHALAAHRPEEEQQLVDDVIERHSERSIHLDEKQNLLVYEAIGCIISALPDPMKGPCINKLMSPCNTAWQQRVQAAAEGVAPEQQEYLYDLSVSKQLVSILRVNQRVAKGTGAAFTPQLQMIYGSMMRLYGLYSQRIMVAVQQYGVSKIKHSDIKSLFLFKRETLHLIESFVETAAQEGPTCRMQIAQELLPNILQPILADYKASVPDTRDYEVLTLLTVLISKLESLINRFLPTIFDYVFDCTLDVIKVDFQSYPDHREKFYELLKACNVHCFEGLFALPPRQLKAYVESLVWAFKHEHLAVAEQGLQATYEFLLKLINEKRDLLGEFCNSFYFSLMKETLLVLTDTLHRAGFRYQTLIFMHLLRVVEFNVVRNEAAGLTRENVMQSLIELLSRSFQTVNQKQVEAFVVDLFNFCRDAKPNRFQQHIRDFLISIKQFSAENDPLHETEREEALARARGLERQRQMQLLTIDENQMKLETTEATLLQHLQVPGMMPQYETMPTVRGGIED